MRYLILILAIAVGVTGFNADAKKRKTHKRKARTTIVEPAPYGYDYIEGNYDDVVEVEKAKYPPEYPGGADGLRHILE